jgi:hypothetical protein
MTMPGRPPAAPRHDVVPPRTKIRAPRLAAAAPALATLVLFGLTVAAFYPGYLSFDSAFQYWQARHRSYSNLPPPAMAIFWTGVDALWPGSGGMFALSALLYWFGIGLFALVAFRGAAARTAAVLVAGLVSPALPIVAHVWTDAALIAVLGAASALMFFAMARESRVGLWLTLPLLLLAGIVRPNALAATVPLLLLWTHAEATTGRAPATASVRRVVALTLALVTVTVGAESLLDRLVVTDRRSAATLGMVFDLAGISVRSGTLVVPPYAPYSSAVTLEWLASSYSPLTNVPLHEGPNGLRADGYSRDERDDLRRRWLAAIAAHPGAYVRHRAAVTVRLFGRYGGDRPPSLAFVPTVVGYRDNPAIVPNRSTLNASVMGAYRAAAGTWLGAPASYALLALVTLLAAWPRRRGVSGKVALALAASGLAYAAPLALIAPAAELRYGGWLFLSSLLAAVACIASRTTRAD